MKRILMFFLTLLSLTSLGQNKIVINGVPLQSDSGVSITNGHLKTDTTVPILTTTGSITAGKYATNRRLYTVDVAGKEGFWHADTADHATAANGGFVLVDANGIRWKRPYTHVVQASWFGIVGDGVTDNTAAFAAMWPYVNGRKIEFGKGTFIVDSLSVPALTNVEMYGVQDSTQFLTTSGDQIFAFNGDLTSVYIHDIFFNCTFTYAPVDFGHGFMYSAGIHINHLKIWKCRFRMPNANATAMNFLCQNPAFPRGSINDLDIEWNIIDSMRQSGLAIMNRDTVGATQPGPSGRDSCLNVTISHNQFRNLGLIGPYGIGITLDGVGNGGLVSDNEFYNNLSVGLENTGYWYYKFDNNRFKGFFSGRTWAACGFSSRPIWYNIIINNQCIDSANAGVAFIGMSYSLFENNNWKVGGSNYCGYRNPNHNKFHHNSYASGYIYGLQIQATPGLTASYNEFDDEIINNSASASNFNVINFDGKGCTQNIVRNSQLFKPNTGSYTGLSDTASPITNYVINPSLNGSWVSNSYDPIVVPAVTRDTLTNDNDLIDNQTYQFTGGDSVHTDTVFIQSRVHTYVRVQNRMATPLWFSLLSSGSGMLLQPGQIASVFCDSINMRPYGQYGSTVVGSNAGQPFFEGAYQRWIDNNGFDRFGIAPGGNPFAGTFNVDSALFYSSALSSQIFSMVAKTQVFNSTAVTNFIGIGNNTPNLPANWANYAGKTFDIDGLAFLTMGSTASNATLSFYVGGVGDSVTFPCPTSVSNVPVEYHIHGMCRNTSSTTAPVTIQGKVIVNGVTYSLYNPVDYTMNTTIVDPVVMLWTFSVASASNASTNYYLTLKTQ